MKLPKIWAKAWFLMAPLIGTLFLAPACSKPEEKEGMVRNLSTEKKAEKDSRPAKVMEALAQGKRENKAVLVELFENTCEYSREMQGVLKEKAVQDALTDLIHVQITSEAKSFIKEFGLRITPAFVFFKPDGEILEPSIQGFRSAPFFAAEIRNYKLKAQNKKEEPLPRDNHPDFGRG